MPKKPKCGGTSRVPKLCSGCQHSLLTIAVLLMDVGTCYQEALAAVTAAHPKMKVPVAVLRRVRKADQLMARIEAHLDHRERQCRLVLNRP